MLKRTKREAVARVIQPTTFAEISGNKSERTKQFSEILRHDMKERLRENTMRSKMTKLP